MIDVSEELVKQLDDLKNVNHCGAGTVRLRVEDRELRCRIASIDRLACEVDVAQVTWSFENLDVDALDTLAGNIAERLSYLEESLVVVEKDTQHMEAQLRSNRPNTMIEDKRSYYEIVVGKGGLVLQRFEKTNGEQRQLVPMIASKAILSRLCRDLLEVRQ